MATNTFNPVLPQVANPTKSYSGSFFDTIENGLERITALAEDALGLKAVLAGKPSVNASPALQQTTDKKTTITPAVALGAIAVFALVVFVVKDK